MARTSKRRGRLPLLLICSCTLLAAGCANTQLSKFKADPALGSGAPAAVALGEPVSLGELPIQRLAAAASPDLSIHVLYLPKSSETLHYVVVQDGKLIDRQAPPVVMQRSDELDAVMDRTGALHVIVGKRYFELGPAGWTEVEGPACRKLIPGGPNVLCLFDLAAPDPRNKQRWDWFGIGSSMGGFIWPWHSKAIKVGIAERSASGWSERGIVDRSSNRSLSYIDAVANQAGDVETVYRRYRTLFSVDDSQLRFERFNAPGHGAAPAPTTGVAALGDHDASWSLLGTTPEEFVALSVREAIDRFWGNPWIAFTQAGGSSVVLMAGQSGGLWVRRIARGTPLPAHKLLDDQGGRSVRGLAATGADRMMALLEEPGGSGWSWSTRPTLLKVVELRRGKWSTPIDVGTASITGVNARLIPVGTQSVAVIGVDPDQRSYIRMLTPIAEPGR